MHGWTTPMMWPTKGGELFTMPRAPDKCRLLHGPYHAPSLHLGDRTGSLMRGVVVIVMDRLAHLVAALPAAGGQIPPVVAPRREAGPRLPHRGGHRSHAPVGE
jgi:hypothetical protein